MRLLALNHVIEACHSIRNNRTRSLLTGLGVAIGVASITIILSLSSGITDVVNRQVESQDNTIAIIRPGQPKNNLEELANPTAQQNYSSSTLTESDASLIESIPNIEAAAPLMTLTGTLSSNQKSITGATILSTTPALQQTTHLPTEDNQFINSATDKNTAVIGNQLAIDLFGTELPIGYTFTIRGQSFTIIGVTKHLRDPINYNGVDFDNAVIINLDNGKALNRGVPQIQQINVRVKDAGKLQETIQEINQKILTNHKGEQDFYIASGEEIARPTSRLFNAIANGLVAIAAISLIVGGIGIMNIMLVSVAERTREIGLRKAVGASNLNIVWQFLTESLIISLLGGLGGYAAGYILAFAISTLLTFPPAFDWHIAAIALALSLGVGVVFGLYPAIRAARKNPIESLREYH